MLVTHPTHPNLTLIENNHLTGVLSHMRDKECPDDEFARYADQLAIGLGWEAFSQDKLIYNRIKTPVSSMRAPMPTNNPRYLIPILGAGLALAQPIRQFVMPNAKIGMLAASRDEETLKATIHYRRLHGESKEAIAWFTDPMLATGDSGESAIEIVSQIPGWVEMNLLTVMASLEAVERLGRSHPNLRIYTLSIEELLPNGYLKPGLGDFGDRWAGLVPVKMT